MKICGLEVDADSIGAGIYDMICDAGMDGVVAFGMIPKGFDDILDRQMRQKIIAIVAQQNGIPEELVKSRVDERKMKDMVGQVKRQVWSAVFSVAKRRGALCV